jgi:uncharacterized membrane protein
VISPFNLRNALLARHAQHVVLIHFPIALFTVGVAFDFISHWTKRSTFAIAAYYNFVVAALATLPVVATGLLAWQFQLEGQKLKGILLLHLLLGIISSLMILLTWNVHFRARESSESLPRYRLLIELAGVGVVGITAHLGGFLSGVNM